MKVELSSGMDHTEYFQAVDVNGVEWSCVCLRVVSRLQQLIQLCPHRCHGLRGLEQVAQRPEGESKRVVVDVQVDEVVAFDLELVLIVRLHELDGTAQVVWQIGSSH